MQKTYRSLASVGNGTKTLLGEQQSHQENTMKKKTTGTTDSKAQGVGNGSPLPSLEARFRAFRKQEGRRELLGFADLVIAGAFVIRGIQVVRVKAEGQEQYGQPFVSFPNRKQGEKFVDMAHPITAEAQQLASKTILAAFEAAGKKEAVPA
jgi:DNA-binding cell septation regulator SpoVG